MVLITPGSQVRSLLRAFFTFCPSFYLPLLFFPEVPALPQFPYPQCFFPPYLSFIPLISSLLYPCAFLYFFFYSPFFSPNFSFSFSSFSPCLTSLSLNFFCTLFLLFYVFFSFSNESSHSSVGRAWC